MDFREYIFKSGKKLTEVAKDLCINSNYLCIIVNGRIKPGKRLAKDIEIYTNHQVKADCISYKFKEKNESLQEK